MIINRAVLMRWMDRARAFDTILQARARTRMPVLSVLCYHSVGDPDAAYPFDDDVVDVTPAQFRTHLEILARHFTIIGIDALCEGVAGGRLPPNPLLISFDDGYRSCVDTALPILQRLGFPATFFIATHYVAQRRLYWWDKIAYLIKNAKHERISLQYPRPLEIDTRDAHAAKNQLLRLVKRERDLDLERFLNGLIEATGVDWSNELEARLADELIMTWDDVRKLSTAGMDIQSHTRHHRVLQTLSSEQMAEELAGSRIELEREIRKPVRTIAYPVGYSIHRIPEIRQAVQKAGYEIGFTNNTGVNYLWRAVDPFDVRRLAMGRDISASMLLGQLAVPPLAYTRGS